MFSRMPELTSVSTGRPEFDELVPRIRRFLEQDTMDLNIDGKPIRGYRSPDTPAVWIRDHSDMMRGFRHFEKDLTSAVTHFAETQAVNGRIFDYFTNRPEKVPCERENWTKYVRVPVEADVEYRFVKAACLAWQATGDDAWIQSMLPAMERALNYIFTDPQRWDAERQLVKRPYTIDSWDFAYSAGHHDWLQFQIDENTFWGIMHGDNSGYYEACRLVANVHARLGDPARATHWNRFADGLRERMNRHCWNGRFYTHFEKITPVTIDGVDEAAQLSFSNAMNINRGVTTPEMAASILREYQARKASTGAFAEWFSIDPAFPDGIFGEEKIVRGAYCNGGIMPLVGGELARAYLENGFEQAGIATLKQYHALISEKGETYLWYFPDGSASTIESSTSPDAMPTDGWGSSAMLFGLLEGLVGIQDKGRLMDRVRLTPRWAADGVTSAEARVGYEASGAAFGYAYSENNDSISLSLESIRPESTGAIEVGFSVLLPQGARVAAVEAPGGAVEFTESTVGESAYVNATFTLDSAAGDLRVRFA
jgi:hypothetical protein